MTAPTRSSIVILGATAATPGAYTKASPSVTGPWVDVRAANGGRIGISVLNGVAPGVAGQFTVQVADDAIGTNVFDLGTAGGNTVANGEVTHLWAFPAEPSYARLLCYGNSTNQVTFKAVLFAKA